MNKRLFGKLISTLLAVLLPAATLTAASPTAMVDSRGTVLLNGTGTAASSAIFAGDRLSTSARSAANIVLEGTSILVEPESSLLYEGKTVGLETGGAHVSTTTQLGTHTGSVSVVPVAATMTRYRISRANDNVFVTVSSGAVKVIDNGTETLLAEGKSMAFDDSQPDPSQDQNNQKKKGGAAAAPPTGGVSKGGAILAGTAAAGAAAAIVLLTTRSHCSSPPCQ